MSSVGTTTTATPTNQHFHFDRLPSKRKLEDYDSPFSRIRKNSNSNSSCKGKSVIDDHELESSSIGDGDNHILQGESSTVKCDLMESPQLQFFVRLFSGGKTLVLRANLDDTVEMVHQKILKVTGIPVMEQGLIYQGKQLQWERTLKECGIQNDAGLQLVGRMRSTDHPRAWRVINDLVSLICRICRKELPFVDPCVVKIKLDQFMALPVDKGYNPASLLYKYERKKANIKKKATLNIDDEEEEDGDDEDEDSGSINKRDYCRIFMDACAPQGLVMLYLSKEKRNQECAEDCIRSFVDFVKDLEGSGIERAYCATMVLELCELLKKMVTEDDLVYIHCRSTLGSMLGKVIVGSGHEGVHSHGGFERKMYGIAIGDVFPFLKEVGERLVKDLKLSVESDASIGPLHRDVRDFSAFLQPVLCFIGRELSAAANSGKVKGRTNPLANEVDLLFCLFNDLLGGIDKCLKKVELCLSVKKKKDVEVYLIGWSQYLAVLKELHSVSLLYPGSEDQFWTTMRQNRKAVCGLIIKHAKRAEDNSWLLKHKDVLDFESRRHLALLVFPEVREDYDELHEMLIDRSNLLAESFEYISQAKPSSLHAGLFMEFKNEEATGPGVLREWFCLVCQAIFDPQNALFVSCPLDRRRFFPSSASKIHPLHLRYFQFSGRVIALALMHKVQVGIVLDRVFFLQLSGRHISMEDIRDADPFIYSSCKQILEMDADFVDSDGLGLTFSTEVEELGTRKVVELCAGGKGISVNSKNRKAYVDLIVQHHFVSSISEQVSYFAQGFADILAEGKHRESLFEYLELGDLDWMLHGSGSDISIEDWKSHTDYHGYRKTDPQIVWFWEVVGQLNADQKRTLLFFWTSVKYLPIEGFRGLASRVYIYKSLDSQDCLPSSHTCFFRLCIPPYPSKAVMQERLLVITQEHVGCSFGTW
ncbi:hypothetical protein SOVF_164200 [Spinacia oleracea]|uniref:HECT-type E3 ubiquitin transferase n=1 Tax=Spinacia oleracea TaxID=3562 RepID=A0A9R0HXP4_SPIOL|nr:E3 ubiquitin-protein ligase UPL5 [Spinacia oleracea]KNA08264.1 hypothetical protein SOVF_164200 [Spinacia oleracea]